jgi:hypothetical protein
MAITHKDCIFYYVCEKYLTCKEERFIERLKCFKSINSTLNNNFNKQISVKTMRLRKCLICGYIYHDNKCVKHNHFEKVHNIKNPCENIHFIRISSVEARKILNSNNNSINNVNSISLSTLVDNE